VRYKEILERINLHADIVTKELDLLRLELTTRENEETGIKLARTTEDTKQIREAVRQIEQRLEALKKVTEKVDKGI
jgi:hypothetical protein